MCSTHRIDRSSNSSTDTLAPARCKWRWLTPPHCFFSSLPAFVWWQTCFCACTCSITSLITTHDTISLIFAVAAATAVRAVPIKEKGADAYSNTNTWNTNKTKKQSQFQPKNIITLLWAVLAASVLIEMTSARINHHCHCRSRSRSRRRHRTPYRHQETQLTSKVMWT